MPPSSLNLARLCFLVLVCFCYLPQSFCGIAKQSIPQAEDEITRSHPDSDSVFRLILSDEDGTRSADTPSHTIDISQYEFAPTERLDKCPVDVLTCHPDQRLRFTGFHHSFGGNMSEKVFIF